MRFTMSRLLLLVTTGALLWITPLPAAETFSADDRDEQTLINTKHFGFGAINADGQVTEGEAALKRIVKQEGGINRLFPVFDRATLAGKCYALAGIRHLAPNSFEDFCKQLEPWKSLRVKTAVGNKVVEEKLSDVIGMIRSGFYSNYLGSTE